jgi:protein-tyrosine phosphatase
MAVSFSILTVCTGNIHRSPLAAELLRTWAGWYLPAPLSAHVVVRSAGLGAPVGAPMGQRAQRIARSLGADGSAHTATQITDGLIAASDLVLVATRRQRDEVLGRVPAALRRTFTRREAGRIAAARDAASRPLVVRDLARVVAELADHRGATAGDADDVIDPQGRDDAAYVQMVAEEVAPLAHLAHALFGMPRPDRDAYLAAAADGETMLTRLAGAEPR